MKRIVYLPDPTVLFYGYKDNIYFCSIFNEYELTKEEILDSSLVPITDRFFNIDAIFTALKEKITKSNQPYFTNMLNNSYLYEIMEFSDGQS